MRFHYGHFARVDYQTSTYMGANSLFCGVPIQARGCIRLHCNQVSSSQQFAKCFGGSILRELLGL